ncbi:hypothetical protein BDP81DRAFT_306201 [Colletotrichum phormii]|uniref:C3H1-type domain-containing protein n=1 Tax=Colletotrichum phormii TaxID=359342 RepID=A0AAJ0EL40_9PEZI|nr:uncharacterized protein BDP81DRAFT_306201 [Colletotrichum phormii]KAK1655891.1 hypothetical protein BDP81DRAFT_306201 [Colletotrichum phormii]
MNNHYPYGYPPYPGQPPAQPQQQQPYSYPIPPLFAQYPQHNENTFDAVSHTQPAYEQNQNMIPGLGGYGHLPQLPQLPQGFGWQQSHEQQPAPQHHWQAPRDGPNLIPASQYYQADNVPMPKAPVASGALPPTAPKRSTKQTSNDAEEGELSDGELDDVYEPQETLPEANSRQQRRNAPNAANANARNGKSSVGYPIASSYGGPKDGGMKHPAGGNDREHSGSYSPHLSPHEVHPRMAPNNQHGASSSQTHVSGGQFNQPVATAASQQQQGKNAVEDARQRARSAISNLWPLGVRRQDFVDEGIDKTVVDNLLTDLKLDTKAPSQFSIPGLSTPASLPGLSYASGQPASQQARTSGPALPPKPPAQQQSSPSAVKSAGEERKDRIARLLAAKGAKTTASSSTNTGAQAGASNDKTLVQQQKMDALQKSREARAQKAADRKGSLQSSQSKEASPVDPSRRPQSAAANVPVVVPASYLARPNALQQSADRQTAPASAIPGLFTSAPQPAPIINQRKRPVASDFVANPYANKRPFGHTQQDTRFVIDVSEGSDDEDVEMEIGSPTDEPSSTQQDTPSLRPASFRDFPPLSNGLQRQLSSPAPSNVTTPQSGAVGSQPKQAHIDVMDKQIEAMKRKIALAEARAKLKAAMGEKSLGQKSAGQTLDTPLDSDGGKPSMRRVQSMGDSHASDPPNGQQSPAIAEPSSSMRLPKPSDNRIQGDSSRSQKLRTVSTNLPLLENRLQTKKSKLRLLQIQMSRLEHEIREEETEKHKLTEEMEQLEQDSDESSEPQNQLKSNSVDPVATATSTVPQSEMQTPLPAAADAEQSSSKVAEQSSSAASVRRSKSPAMSLDKDASDAADDAENAVTGKAATSPSQVPPSTETPMPALHETPTSPETAGDDDAITSDDASDVAMAESDDSSSSEPEHEDDYEPAENVVPAAAAKSPSTSPVAAESAVSLVNSDTDSQQPSARASQIPEQISLGVNESTPEQDVNAAPLATQSTDEASSSGERFTPYESPLQYFRAYRYHPKFAETVPGGLRSLTYSNRIDPNLPICPDQLASRECPRGADCIYQHFESMKLPDDQILLQLGGTTLEGPEKTQFNDGLRKLLQEMRSQNIKDFPSIAKGIVEYHNRFTGDPSKILPLGNVSI